MKELARQSGAIGVRLYTEHENVNAKATVSKKSSVTCMLVCMNVMYIEVVHLCRVLLVWDTLSFYFPPFYSMPSCVSITSVDMIGTCSLCGIVLISVKFSCNGC